MLNLVVINKEVSICSSKLQAQASDSCKEKKIGDFLEKSDAIREQRGLPELIEFEGLDPGPPRPRPELDPRPLPPRRDPLSSLPIPRGLWSRSVRSSGSEALDSSEFVPGLSRQSNRIYFSFYD